MNQGFRRAAVGIPGFCAFLNLYAPQSLLPLLAQEFAATPADISLTMTATALAIAITAPFAGAIADVLGRKRVIVGRDAAARHSDRDDRVRAEPARADRSGASRRGWCCRRSSPSWSPISARNGRPREATGVTGLYMAATSFGGFCGRFFSGLLADTIGWRNGFIAIAAVTLRRAASRSPRSCRASATSCAPKASLASARQMLGHLRNPRLLAIYAVGFGTLFNFVALFTYVNFVLAAPPFNLSPTLLGAIFVTYLAGSRRGALARPRGRALRTAHADHRHHRGVGVRRAADARPLALGDHRAGSRSRPAAASSPRRPRPPRWR